MEKTFKHLILTLFNVRFRMQPDLNIEAVNKTLVGKDLCLDIDYLSFRWELFSKYTIPAIINQSIKNFEWLIFLHTETPEKILSNFKSLEQSKSNIRLVYMTDNEGIEYQKSITDYINKQYNYDYLVTSRIDSDDSVSLDYVENIQSYFTRAKFKRRAINFTHGFRFVDEGALILPQKIRSGHFISLLSENNGEEHAYLYKHPTISEHIPLKELGTKSNPMWIEVVHKYNWINGVNQNQRAKSYIKKFEFLNLAGEDEYLYMPESGLQNLFKNMIFHTKFGRRIARKIKK